MAKPRKAPPHQYAMRPGWRWLIVWFPYVWLLAAVVLLITGGGTAQLLWIIFLAYGFALIVLSRFQILIVRVRDDRLIEFVSLARVIPVFLDDLVEVAPAPGPLQRRFATRFKSNHNRVTVLSGMFAGFDALVAEVERRTEARILRY